MTPHEHFLPGFCPICLADLVAVMNARRAARRRARAARRALLARGVV